jgi:cell division protein FtsA
MAEVEPEDLLNVAVLGESAGQTIQRRRLCEIIEARMGEICSLVREEVKRSGHAGMLPAGAVLTGGGARLSGIEVLARDTLEMPVRAGSPQGVGGLMDQIGNPAFSTPIGLLLWGANHLGEEPIGYGGGNGTNPLSRIGEWVRNLFPG